MIEFSRGFNINVQGRSLEFDLITPEKNVLAGYRIQPKNEADLPEIQQLFDAVRADKSLNVSDLSKRLKLLNGVSAVQVKVSHLISRNFPGKERMALLMQMAESLSSEADIHSLCRKCLELNNYNSHLALTELKSAFKLAQAGRLSDKITDLLLKMASDKNVDDIEAFGKGKKTFKVVKFLKKLPQTASGAIDLTKMKKLDAGGTHDVFLLEDKGAPKFVLKVNRASLEMQPEERNTKYHTDNAAYQKLHRAFGDHCTIEQLLLRTIVDDEGAKDAIISVADFETGFDKESKIGLIAAYFEANQLGLAAQPETYEKMLKGLFFPGQEALFDFDTYLTFNPDAGQLATLIKKDADFGRSLKEFLILFRDYFKDTGQYLDIQGHDNIIFFKEGERWTFKLGTVIKQETKHEFSKALDWIASQAAEPPDPDLRWQLKHCLHWTKTLNALGMALGIGRVIEDNNTHRAHELWSLLKAREVMMPLKTERILQIGNLQNLPPEEMVSSLKAMDFNPEEDIDLLMNLFSGFAPDKQLVLAEYLHQILPRAISEQPDLSYCPSRCRMAESLKDFPEGRALALEFLQDVSRDPQAPKLEVQRMIKELESQLLH